MSRLARSLSPPRSIVGAVGGGIGRSDVGSLVLESKDDRRQPAARAINERLLMVYLGHDHQLGNLFHAELSPPAKLG